MTKDTKIEILEIENQDLKYKLSMLDKKIDAQFKWIVGTIIALFGVILLHIAAHMDF